MISVREVIPSDLNAVADLFNEVVQEGNAFVFEAPFSVSIVRSIVRKQSASFVAVREKQVVGVYLLHPNTPGRGSHIANAIYAVKRCFRSQGIGSKLTEHSLNIARKKGFKAIQFNCVVETNCPAIKLWRKYGFQIVGTVPKAFRNKDGRYVDIHIFHRFL